MLKQPKNSIFRCGYDKHLKRRNTASSNHQMQEAINSKSPYPLLPVEDCKQLDSSDNFHNDVYVWMPQFHDNLTDDGNSHILYWKPDVCLFKRWSDCEKNIRLNTSLWFRITCSVFQIMYIFRISECTKSVNYKCLKNIFSLFEIAFRLLEIAFRREQTISIKRILLKNHIRFIQKFLFSNCQNKNHLF